MLNTNDTQIREYRKSLLTNFFKAVDLIDDMQYGAMQAGNKEMEMDLSTAKSHILAAQFDFLHYEEKVMTNTIKEPDKEPDKEIVEELNL